MIYLKASVEEIETNKVMVKVEVPSEEVDRAIENACRDISKKISVPGFRSGKIPSRVVKSRVGMQTVYDEAVRQLVPVYYQKAVQETEIEPVAQPEIDVVQIEEGKELKFNATVEVKPEVKLGEYKKLEVAKDTFEIKDEWVDRQVQALRDRFAQLDPVERPVRDGDFVLMNFEGKVDGKAFEGGSANDYLLEIGSKTFVGDFEAQLVGARKGEIKDIFVDFPEDYGNPAIAGKKPQFRVLVKEVKQKSLPDLDDDFAKEVSEFDTLEELRQDIRDKLTKSREKQVDFKLRMDVLNKACENAEVEIPESMVNTRKEAKIKELTETLSRQSVKLEDYLRTTGQDREKFEKEAENEATQELKRELVLEAVSKAEKLEITDEQTDNEIRKLAESMKKDPNEAIRAAHRQGTFEFFRGNLLTRDTWKWLVDQADISEKAPEAAEEPSKSPEESAKKEEIEKREEIEKTEQAEKSEEQEK